MNAQLNINNNAAPNTGKKQNITQRQNVIQTIKRLEKTSIQYKINHILYLQDCEYQWEGTGNNKVWAPIEGTCKNNAYDRCGDVQKQKLKQVPYNDCQNVPKQVGIQEEFLKILKQKLITRSVRKFQSKNAEQ